MRKFTANGLRTRKWRRRSPLARALPGRAHSARMKHVGLNVAADPLFTMSYIGVNGGMVLAVADDPGLHSSQNEQDSRNYAIAAKLPMLEPADSAECRDFTKLAYAAVRAVRYAGAPALDARASRTQPQSSVELCEREEHATQAVREEPCEKRHAARLLRSRSTVRWRSARRSFPPGRDEAGHQPRWRTIGFRGRCDRFRRGTTSMQERRWAIPCPILKLGMVQPAAPQELSKSWPPRSRRSMSLRSSTM